MASLQELFYGSPPQYGVRTTGAMRPPMYQYAKRLGEYLSSLIGQPMPTYPGQLDPGMSPTMQMLGKAMQGYAGSNAPPILGATANSLARFMNPSFTNPVARIGWGSPGYAPVNMNAPMWGGGSAGSLYDQFQLPPSYSLPMAPGWDGGKAMGGGAGGFDGGGMSVGGNLYNDPFWGPILGNPNTPNMGPDYSAPGGQSSSMNPGGGSGYWTPERMRGAQPMGMGVGGAQGQNMRGQAPWGPGVGALRSPVYPGKTPWAPPSYLGGWAPGGNPQPPPTWGEKSW